MSFPVTVGLNYGDELTTSTSKHGRALGTVGVLPDGRAFKWALNSTAAALEGGVLVQGAAPNSSQDAGLDIVGGSASAITLGVITQAATTRDQYVDGYLTVDTGPGEGLFRIGANTSGASGTEVTISFEGEAKIVTAMSSGTTKVGLYESPYKNAVVAPTTITGPVLGFSPADVPAGEYFWVQDRGWGIANADAAPVVNTDLIFGGTSAGHVNPRSSALDDVPEFSVARSITAGGGADVINFVDITLR